jgi:hypothetical protein
VYTNDEASDFAGSIEVVMATRREMLTRLEHGKPVRRVAGHMQAWSVRRPGSLLVVGLSDHHQSATPGPRWAEALTTVCDHHPRTKDPPRTLKNWRHGHLNTSIGRAIVLILL